MNMANDKPFGKAQDKLHGRKTLKVANFLDEFEKDDVKRSVDIVALFGHFSVSLTKKGKSYLGRCPWHDDANPSLSVDREKGVYNCFGCGEAGDIFTLTEKMRGVGFVEALAFLKSWSETAVKESESPVEEHATTIDIPLNQTSPSGTDGEAHSAALLPARFGSAQRESVSLTTVAEYYHRKLGENKKALEYLAARGLGSPEIQGRFCIGYADGSLLSIIGEEQKHELVKLGVLNDRGNEHMAGCVTFPIVNDLDQVVGLYGRSIDDASPKHRYLKGKHKGIFNRKASRVFDEIILAESIIDALSLVALGIENVQAIYGTNGFTDEHLRILTDDRVKTVVLALDADEAGRVASEKLKDRLVAEGFAVKVIHPGALVPSGAEAKDWNEYLINGGTAEAVKESIATAVIHQTPAPAASDTTIEKIPFGYDFTMNDVAYSISGTREIFVGNLRARLSARLASGEKYYDTLDLYSARSRSGFAGNLAREFSLEQKRIEKDLVRILEYLERERDRALLANHGKDEREPMTAEERAIGMGFLTSPNLFDELAEDMAVLGYVGESMNKQLLYIAASSRKLDDPISVLIISQSASGKSMLVDTVKELIPPEDVIAVTSLSDQALNYVADLEHKFLILSEAIHNEVVEHQLREMLSAKELSRLVTMKDQKTGELRTKLVKTKAIVSTVMSSTRYEVNPENASRSFTIDTDESREQTRRIHERQRNKYSYERYVEKTDMVPRIKKKHHAAQRLLIPRVIFNPFAHYLDFPDVLMRTRRDNERFIDLIACVAFIRQYQKEVKRRGTIEHIECDLDDYRIAFPIMIEGVLSSTMRDIPKGTIDLYEDLRTMVRKTARKEDLEAHEVSFTQRDVREHTGLNNMTVKRALRTLVDYEYLATIRSGARTKGVYRLRADEAMNTLDFAMIPTPEEIATRINDMLNGQQ